MTLTTRWWLAAPLTMGLVLAGCAGDDDDTSDAGYGAAASGEADAADAGDDSGSAAGTMTLGGEQVAMTTLRCYFEEQPRAGLGGVFTHTAQGQGTDAEGVEVLLDVSRARAEDGTVEDDVIVDIGDPFGDDLVSLSGSGPEGLVQFGDASVAADGIEVTDFETEPVTLSFDLACG